MRDEKIDAGVSTSIIIIIEKNKKTNKQTKKTKEKMDEGSTESSSRVIITSL